MICFCDDQGDEQTSSGGEPDAGSGAQESIGAHPPGEGAPNMGGGSGDSGWTDFDLDVLAEPSSETDLEGTSVNQPEAGRVPPALPVAPEEAGIPPVVPYPYQEDEMIGGDSVLSIRKRLLASNSEPSAEAINLAHLDAQDRFEVKVDIVRHMAVLDPSGDWMVRGARALDNPHASSSEGEPSLIELYRIRDELYEGGEGFSGNKKPFPTEGILLRLPRETDISFSVGSKHVLTRNSQPMIPMFREKKDSSIR